MFIDFNILTQLGRGTLLQLNNKFFSNIKLKKRCNDCLSFDALSQWNNENKRFIVLHVILLLHYWSTKIPLLFYGQSFIVTVPNLYMKYSALLKQHVPKIKNVCKYLLLLRFDCRHNYLSRFKHMLETLWNIQWHIKWEKTAFLVIACFQL